MSFLTNRTLVTAVLSAIVTALALAGVFLLFRGDDNAPIQVFPPTPQAAETPAVEAVASVEVRVHVSGAVTNPGVYRMSAQQRLADALTDAGGATADADLDAVNLAQWLQDGQQYHIPTAGEIAPPARSESANALVLAPTDDPGCGGLMDLNAASEAELDTLPRIGPVRAGDIVAYRELNGPFTSVDEITEISGIGPATLEGIRPLVAVCG